MKVLRIILLTAVLMGAAVACAPKQAAEKSALETIANRKSVRSYTGQAVSQEQIETLMRAAMAA